jgi:hypothetical protein
VTRCGHHKGDITSDLCKGIPEPYSGDRAEIIWTHADIAALKKACPAPVADASISPATPDYGLARWTPIFLCGVIGYYVL